MISPLQNEVAAPVPAVSDKRVDELAMLIRRLVRRLNQELPHNDIGEAAMDYLARNGISGEILRGWAALAVPDCQTCANRGRVNGLSQESYCDGCVYQGRGWRKNHFVDARKMADAVKRRCEACAILPCSCK